MPVPLPYFTVIVEAEPISLQTAIACLFVVINAPYATPVQVTLTPLATSLSGVQTLKKYSLGQFFTNSFIKWSVKFSYIIAHNLCLSALIIVLLILYNAMITICTISLDIRISKSY
jgi:hypothetical protein